jgi:mannosyl-3-phosphoglycerate phosphatase
MSYLIFTDLDGTLLNHDDYSFKDAIPMLEVIKKREIPLIFTTSKTKKECEILQDKIGIKEPFIVENGAAIFGLEGGVIKLGLGYKEIRVFMDSIKDEFDLLAFSSMSVSDVMEWTGFSKENATMAKNRDFSEPFLIKDERKLTHIEKLAEQNGMKILKGGRFYHCVGINQDKGKAVKRALEHLGGGLTSIGLGDNYNDVDMLRVVDIPILLPHHQNRYIDIDLKKDYIKAPFTGAKGWNESLKKVLNEL